MSRIIAVANVKGGVGKTTTTGNLCAALAERGLRVLAIDLDPQASLTISFGCKLAETTRTIGDALSANLIPLRELTIGTQEAFDLVPANHNLRQTEHYLENGRIRIFALKNALASLRSQYDYMLLDCPANAGILTGNALAAADEVVVPFPADYLAMQALGWFLQIVGEIKNRLNPALRIAGLFLSMYDPRLRHAREILAEVQTEFGIEAPFFSAAVRSTVAMKQAARAGQSILKFAPGSQAAEAYRLLAQELEKGLRESTQDAHSCIQKGRRSIRRGPRCCLYCLLSGDAPFSAVDRGLARTRRDRLYMGGVRSQLR